MSIFGRPTIMKTCVNCPAQFDTTNPAAKYCETCRPLMKREKSRLATAKKRAEYRTYSPPPVVRKPAPQRTVLRAPSLAACDDTPAVMAVRDSMLTGAAAATMQATSGGRIGVV